MKSVLFVCLGNICRSPMAETIFNKILEKRGISEEFKVDSAGLHDYHEGEKADARMRTNAQKRGYDIIHISRPVEVNDFENFDYIIGMDDSNVRQLKRMAKNASQESKVYKMTDFTKNLTSENIPDPYYGGDAGFIRVIDLLEDACEGFADFILSRKTD